LALLFAARLGGLEVKLPNSEKWQKVGHLGGAIFLNAGELLSIWTNGLFPALVIIFYLGVPIDLNSGHLNLFAQSNFSHDCTQ